MIQKFITDIGLKSINEDERSFVAWASRSSIDRDDEIIEASGWELKNFKRNPVVPLFHDYWQFPAAKALWVIQEPKDKPIGLMFKPQFAETALGQEAFYLYQNGYMNAFSVGFDPLVWEYDGEQYSKAKDGEFGIWQKGIIEQKKKKPRCKYIKQELLEISGVVVPAHPDALIEARSYVKTPELGKYLDAMIEKQSDPEIARVKAEIAELRAKMAKLEAHDASEIDLDDEDQLDFLEDDEGETLDFLEEDNEHALEFLEG